MTRQSIHPGLRYNGIDLLAERMKSLTICCLPEIISKAKIPFPIFVTYYSSTLLHREVFIYLTKNVAQGLGFHFTSRCFGIVVDVALRCFQLSILDESLKCYV